MTQSLVLDLLTVCMVDTVDIFTACIADTHLHRMQQHPVSHVLVWHNMLSVVLLSRHYLMSGWQRSPALIQELMADLSSDKCLFTCRHSVHGDRRVQSTSSIQAFWWYSVLWFVSMDCCLCCNRAAFMSGEPNWLHA